MPQRTPAVPAVHFRGKHSAAETRKLDQLVDTQRCGILLQLAEYQQRHFGVRIRQQRSGGNGLACVLVERAALAVRRNEQHMLLVAQRASRLGRGTGVAVRWPMRRAGI